MSDHNNRLDFIQYTVPWFREKYGSLIKDYISIRVIPEVLFPLLDITFQYIKLSNDTRGDDEQTRVNTVKYKEGSLDIILHKSTDDIDLMIAAQETMSVYICHNCGTFSNNCKYREIEDKDVIDMKVLCDKCFDFLKIINSNEPCYVYTIDIANKRYIVDKMFSTGKQAFEYCKLHYNADFLGRISIITHK